MRIKNLLDKMFQRAGPYAGIESIEKGLRDNSFLAVLDGDSFLGILTPSDIIESPHQLVIDCVHDRPRVDPDQDIESVLMLMKETRNSVLPVFKDDEFIGVVTQAAITDYLSEYRNELNRVILERTAELAKANEQLKREIEDRKRAEESLRESEERYRTILENMVDGYYEVDLAGNLTFFNKSLCNMAGYTRDELMGMNNREYMGEEAAKRVYQVFNGVYETGKPVKMFEYQIILQKDGSKRDMESSVALIRDAEGQPIGFRGVLRDVTERRQAEKALERSKKEWEATFDAISDWVCLIDLEHRILRTNRAVEGFVGAPSAKVFGRKCCQVAHGSETPIPVCPFEKMLQTHSRETVDIHLPEADRWLMVAVDPVRDSAGNLVGAVHIVRDITEIKRMEEERIKGEKFESLGILAGGIAHEFNNALTSITGYTGLLEMDYPQDEKIMDYAKAMKQSAHLMARLTSQLLAYARGGRYNPQTMPLSEYVEGTLSLIRHTLDPAVRVETDLPPDILNIEADRTQMQMVLSALMDNAKEAIEGPGCIRITAKNVEVDQDFIKDYPGLKLGRYVCLSIEDDGKGMDEETKNRIFEPFFTTHFMGRGLGMASVYGIVTNH
ncbi:MAG: PAS domain S-box protein, partial [Pseudomonadota bacterium]